ncbi:MAG: gamma-glutamylcyclotransferase family protein [Pseudomonadota bacterium]
MQHLFIYGTLAPGRVNHHVMEGIPGTWQKATLRGVLFEEGWGSDLGCPGIVPDETAAPVQGYVFSSDKLHEHWRRLDEFEGIEYIRQSVTVTLDSGDALSAYVYAVNSPT